MIPLFQPYSLDKNSFNLSYMIPTVSGQHVRDVVACSRKVCPSLLNTVFYVTKLLCRLFVSHSVLVTCKLTSTLLTACCVNNATDHNCGGYRQHCSFSTVVPALAARRYASAGVCVSVCVCVCVCVSHAGIVSKRLQRSS